LTEVQQYPASCMYLILKSYHSIHKLTFFYWKPFHNSVGDAVEKWFFERHDSRYRNGIENPPGDGVLPGFQLKIDTSKEQIRELIRYLYSNSPVLYGST
jgi:hypothetical protein